MAKKFTILIADRNRNVREFLKREMIAEGYRVRLAKNGQEVLKLAYQHGPLDLLILDMDLPDAIEIPVLEVLGDRICRGLMFQKTLER
ncbi:MAG: response regulator [Deltaproteobacteria bacterium]|nr:response regulator [Deltaproteobacteria bacterium]